MRLPPEGRRHEWSFAQDRDELEAAGFTIVGIEIGEEPRAQVYDAEALADMVRAAARRRVREAE